MTPQTDKLTQTSKELLSNLTAKLNEWAAEELGYSAEYYICELCKVGPCKLKLRKNQQSLWYYECRKCKKRFGCDSALAHHKLSKAC